VSSALKGACLGGYILSTAEPPPALLDATSGTTADGKKIDP